jgi:hypothetical protein
MKKSFFYLIVILLPWLVVEGFFRLLPVSNPPYILPVSAADPATHYQPNIDYIYSKGWNFAIRTKQHTNNYGYNNVSDYEPLQMSPLLMVIGDSYVEALQVDSGKSAAEILNAQVRERGRVYSIGLSGAALPQYLVYAEFARTTFHPDAMAFVIIENDFDESLLKYKSEPRLHYFEESGGQLSLRRIDFELSALKKVLRRSALARYVVLNLSAERVLKDFLWSLCSCGRRPSYRDDDPVALETRVKDSMNAVDYFLEEVPAKSGLASNAVVFLLDAMRPAMYSPEGLANAQTGYVARMRKYFKEQAIARGYEVLDMEAAFTKRSLLDGSRFEFATDQHWNEVGHQLVAKEIEGSALFRRVLRH